MIDDKSKPKRKWRWISLAVLVGVIGVTGLLAAYLQSNSFRQRMRSELIAQLERVTGGRVELREFSWNLAQLRFDIDDLTIHGLEKPGEVPYAHLDHAQVSLKIVSLLGRDFRLRELDVQHPVVHLIVYSDGTTNQPRPKVAASGRNSTPTNLFEVRLDRLKIADGIAQLNDSLVASLVEWEIRVCSDRRNLRFRSSANGSKLQSQP
jgi:translocation and assembly module TamB